MIVPMKKVSLITLGNKRSETLKELRKMGLMHIEIAEGNGERINELKGQISMVENAIFSIEEKIKKITEFKDVPVEEAVAAATASSVVASLNSIIFLTFSSMLKTAFSIIEI